MESLFSLLSDLLSYATAGNKSSSAKKNAINVAFIFILILLIGFIIYVQYL